MPAHLGVEGVAEEADDGPEIVSVGRPLGGFAVRIVDEDRLPVVDALSNDAPVR